jgi:Putative inner membrane exporter, YdcZ
MITTLSLTKRFIIQEQSQNPYILKFFRLYGKDGDLLHDLEKPVYVLGNILAIPRLGVVATICSAITGQIIGSYLVDAFGRFGVSKLPFSSTRLAGIILLFIGVILATRK